MHAQTIIEVIDTSPLNRGLRGVDWLADNRNIPVVVDEDVTLFDYESAGMYQVHVLYKSRGRQAIDRAKEAFAEMFTKHNASVIIGLVPDFRRDVKLVARWTGGKNTGLVETEHGPCEVYVWTDEMWKRQQS